MRFGDELLHGDAARARTRAGCSAAAARARSRSRPARSRARGDDRGARRRDAPSADSRSVDLQRHFLSALLLWVERWYEASRTEQRDADDADVQLYRRFAELLERDFARHHDARTTPTRCACRKRVCSRALAHVTGRATKELITDRRMLEAARLLRSPT